MFGNPIQNPVENPVGNPVVGNPVGNRRESCGRVPRPAPKPLLWLKTPSFQLLGKNNVQACLRARKHLLTMNNLDAFVASEVENLKSIKSIMSNTMIITTRMNTMLQCCIQSPKCLKKQKWFAYLPSINQIQSLQWLPEFPPAIFTGAALLPPSMEDPKRLLTEIPLSVIFVLVAETNIFHIFGVRLEYANPHLHMFLHVCEHKY